MIISGAYSAQREDIDAMLARSGVRKFSHYKAYYFGAQELVGALGSPIF